VPAKGTGAVLLPLLAVLTVGTYAATPQDAAIGALYFASKKSAVVVRVNRSGPYATVLLRGGRMEGEFVNEPILVQQFPFGWQPLDLVNFRCRIDSHALEPQVEAALMRGPLVPSVVVSGNWPIGEWYGGGGGSSLYKQRDGKWELVMSDGGAMAVEDVQHYGVPQSDWCKFGIYGAKCP